ncbi:MAG: methionine synthase [Propionibacteriaceae bacterium]|nr:methionine synthase [Propionibacteriaceae bacterium]
MTSQLRDLLTHRVLIGDGAMGTELDRLNLPAASFAGYDGCNEILNVTCPEVIGKVHRTYLDAGADFILTNTFGCNLTALHDHGLNERSAELAAAATQIARAAATEATAANPTRPRFVIGDVGPGTKLPTLSQVTFAELRDAYSVQIRAMAEQGIDAVLLETCQDLLQAKAAVIAAKRVRAELGIDLPIWASITIEPTGTMLLGGDVSAALTVLEALGVEVVGLNCATGPDMMAAYLQTLSRHATVRLRCAPNAGLPRLTSDGPVYSLTPQAFASTLADFANRYGLAVLDGCCGTTPEHIRALANALADASPRERTPEPLHSISSSYEPVSLWQDTNYLAIGERANISGSQAFRAAMLCDDYDQAVAVAKRQTNTHVLDLCVDYVGRDGVQDMRELATRFATVIDRPVMLDSAVPAVIQAGLEHTPGRAIVNSVHLEDPVKFATIAELAAEHGAVVVALTIDEQGMARTTERKIAVAERLLAELAKYGIAAQHVLIDFLTYPITTGSAENRSDAAATIQAIAELKRLHPEVGTVLGVSNVSFGIKPAARRVLNSVFLHEARLAGLRAAIVDAARIVALHTIPASQQRHAHNLIWNCRQAGYDPLGAFLAEFAETTNTACEQKERYPGLSIVEKLTRRIIFGDNDALKVDLDAAIAAGYEPLELINTHLLEGMRQVGEMFADGRMQLPFVLASAETMKQAVTYLEPLIATQLTDNAKGIIVLATVRGDVHDIGKNLVDIILSNNGYRVLNLGIKQPISAIITAALAENADAIGLSGLLVKSTVVMKDYLAELTRQGLAERFPVVLGGAALTKAYVTEQVAPDYPGVVRYAKDAFAGLAFMEEIAAAKKKRTHTPPAAQSAFVDKQPRSNSEASAADSSANSPALLTFVEQERSEPLAALPALTPPFWGVKTVNVELADLLEQLDLSVLLRARWGLRALDGIDNLIAQQQPRLQAAIERISELVEPKAVYGYFPVSVMNDTLNVLDTTGVQIAQFTFPRQTRSPYRCLSDFFVTTSPKSPAVAPLQLVTLGTRLATGVQKLFTTDRYRDYLELHGLGMQLAETLADWLHNQIRHQLGVATNQGERFSFGYPACPDLSQRQILFDLLGADVLGVQLSKTFQLDPEASTDAFIVLHPQARHFSLH